MASIKNSSLEGIRDQLKNILLAKHKGNNADYFKLLDRTKLSDQCMKEADLKFWLRSLSQNVSSIIEYKCDELLNLLLYKCPWLVSSSTHYKCLNSFIHFCLQLFSYRALYIPQLLRHLLSQLALPLTGEAAQVSKISIGEVQFDSIESLKKYVQDIIAKLNESKEEKDKKCLEIVDKKTLSFLNELFARHHKAKDKLANGKALKVYYGKNCSYKEKSTYCFYIEHSEGKKEEISYLKCIAGVRDEMTSYQGTAFKKQYDDRAGKISEFVLKTLKSFPLSQAQIIQLLIERFPYKKVKIEQQYSYFKMMLELALKHESAEEQILSVCIDKFLQIDADIQAVHNNKIISNKQDIEEKLNKASSKLYPEAEQKINFLLGLFFDYLDSSMSRLKEKGQEKEGHKGSDYANDSEEYFDVLLKVLEEKIIIAHKTNYIQYIWLYLYSKPDLSLFRQKIISLLIIQTFNSKLLINSRMGYMNFFASFIAASTVTESDLVIGALQIGLSKFEEKKSKMNPKLVSHFIQCILYIMCFKWDVIKTNNELAISLLQNLITKNQTMLTYVEPSILTECTLMLQCDDGLNNATEVEILDQCMLKQKEMKIRPSNPHLLFEGMNVLPIIAEKIPGGINSFTYRQNQGVKRKASSFNTAHSGSIENFLGCPKTAQAPTKEDANIEDSST